MTLDDEDEVDDDADLDDFDDNDEDVIHLLTTLWIRKTVLLRMNDGGFDFGDDASY